jgi:hypothetical protein
MSDRLTPAQARLLDLIVEYANGDSEPMWLARSELRTARSLEEKGLIRLRHNDNMTEVLAEPT